MLATVLIDFVVWAKRGAQRIGEFLAMSFSPMLFVTAIVASRFVPPCG